MITDKIFHTIKFIGGANKFEALPICNLPEIVFWGRSNVGKSSTINSIFNHKNLARVSQNPGRTQQINLFMLGKNEAVVADLPGYGYANVSKVISENLYQLCYDYINTRQFLRMFLLIDSRRGLMMADLDVLTALQSLGHKVSFILTKSDLVDNNRIATLKEELKQFNVESFTMSNKTKNGALELRNKIINILNASKNRSKKS